MGMDVHQAGQNCAGRKTLRTRKVLRLSGNTRNPAIFRDESKPSPEFSFVKNQVRQPAGFDRIRLSRIPERAIQIHGGADQSQVGKRLREVPQRLAAGAGLLGKKPQVVRMADHLLE